MNVNYAQYAQYEDYGKRLVAMMDEPTPEVAACTEELVTDLFTDLKSPKEPLEEVKDKIFKPVVVLDGEPVRTNSEPN